MKRARKPRNIKVYGAEFKNLPKYGFTAWEHFPGRAGYFADVHRSRQTKHQVP